MSDLLYQFVAITGPSCVGKSPLRRAFYRYHPELAQQLTLLTLYTSRLPRPGEQDGDQYYFRSRTEIEALNQEKFIVENVRGDIQAVDPQSIIDRVYEGQKVLYEGNPFIARKLAAFAQENQLNHISIFLSPLKLDEIHHYLETHPPSDLERTLTEYMQQKLLKRAKSFEADHELIDLSNLHRRAASAFKELAMAPDFDFVIPNHDGEDSHNWDLFGEPIGEAGEALKSFVEILLSGQSEKAEKWPASLLPK